MKYIFLLLFFILAANCITAQVAGDSTVCDAGCIFTIEKTDAKTFYFIDNNTNANPENIQQQHFSPLSSFSERNKIPNKLVTKTIWLSFACNNSLDKNADVFFYPGYLFNSIALYKKNKQGNLDMVFNDASSGFIPIQLHAKELNIYFIKLKMFKLKYNRIRAVLINKDYLNEYKYNLDAPYNETNNGMKLVSGMLLLMVMFTLVNFIISRRAEFFYNFLYSVLMFFLIFLNAFLVRSSGWIGGFFSAWLDLLLLIAATLAYIQFVIIFLSTTIQNNWLNKFLRFEKITIVILMAVYTYLHFFTNTFNPQEILENVMKIFMLIAAIIYIIAALQEKNKLVNYLVAGTAIQIVFYILSFVILLIAGTQTNLFTSASFYFCIGIIASVVFYIMGLTYKTRQEFIEKINERQAMKLEMEKKEFEKQLEVINARQNERNRISADMHDDLGSGMTTIRLYSEIALNKMGENKIPEVEKISNSANDLLNKMNAIIWSMSSSNDTFSNMAAYIRSYTIGYCEDNNIVCEIELPKTIPDLVVSGEIRRNVFLVVKEALHNIVKHSGAGKVLLTLLEKDNKMVFTIHDNGKGIDLSKPRAFGNGLRNMKKRMEDLGIEFMIENKEGTLITMKYDLEKGFTPVEI